jgi:hypothetical protein
VARRERIGRVGAWAVFVGGRLAPGEMVEMGGGGRQGEESVTEKRDGVGGGFGEDRISPFSIHRQLPTNFPASRFTVPEQKITCSTVRYRATDVKDATEICLPKQIKVIETPAIAAFT